MRLDHYGVAGSRVTAAHLPTQAAAKAQAKVKTELLDGRRAQALAVFLGSKEKMFMFWVNAIKEVYPGPGLGLGLLDLDS